MSTTYFLPTRRLINDKLGICELPSAYKSVNYTNSDDALHVDDLGHSNFHFANISLVAV